MASIEERRNKSGKITSWRVIWYGKNGKKSQSYKDQRQAESWKYLLDEARDDAKKAEELLLSRSSHALTLRDMAASHIDRLIDVQPYTIKSYKTYTRLHLHNLADIPVDKISEDDMIRWTKIMIEGGKSSKTIRNVHGFMHAVMNTAVKKKHAKENIMDGEYLPRRRNQSSGLELLSLRDFDILIAHISEFYQPFIRFLLETGMRVGEASALTVKDFQLDAKVPQVRVDKAWKWAKGNTVKLGEPKTSKGFRTVSLASDTVERMRPLLADKQPHDLAFTTKTGLVITASRLHKLFWQKSVAAAMADGMTVKPRIHDLRHTHASLMISHGMNLFNLANRLGHESVQTTTQVYGHLVPDALKEGASIADVAFGRKEIS